jgi:hypothetical protein
LLFLGTQCDFFRGQARGSLSRQWREQNTIDEARELLAGMYSEFAEGLETADPATAERLLERQ